MYKTKYLIIVYMSLLISLLYIVLSCSNDNKEEFDYGGYVYDNISKNPIENVKVTVNEDSNKITTYTDNNGFFKFRLKVSKVPFGAMSIDIRYCEFVRNGYKILNGELIQGKIDKIFYMTKDNTSD